MDIKMLVMDVDGTLTDGKIYMSPNGELMKAFNIKDGYAIARLKNYSIIPAIITGRHSDIVKNRCRELKIDELYQGIDDKVIQLQNICDKHNLDMVNVAYIGDDLNDLPCMQICGLSACPNDAVKEVKDVVNYVCQKCGGQGAVREFIDYIINQL